MHNQWLTGAHLADGREVDVEIRGGVVTAVHPAADRTGTDLRGYLLSGAFAEPHTHLDKAFTFDHVDNPDGTLSGAMASYEEVIRTAPPAQIRDRARRAIRGLVASGATAIRTHVGCGRLLGDRAIRAIAELRAEADGLVDLQIVAHVGGPGEGRTWAQHRHFLEEALDAGADLVGGNPWSEDDPIAALHECFDVAVSRGVGVDFHIDEHTVGGRLLLRDLAGLAREAEVPVTASHCVLLGMQSPGVIAEVAVELAEAGVSVITLPATNLYLQGRADPARERGLTAVSELTAAGVVVAAGADNIRDPFNPTGRCDPLEVAALSVLAAHQEPGDAWELVSNSARRVMGLDPVGPWAGSAADLVAIRANTQAEAIAGASPDRLVWRAGQLLSQTRLTAQGPIHDW